VFCFVKVSGGGRKITQSVGETTGGEGKKRKPAEVFEQRQSEKEEGKRGVRTRFGPVRKGGD